MNIQITLTEGQMLALACEHINKTTNLDVKPGELNFEVKTKQNYKAEWEKGSFRVTLNMERTP